MTRTTLFAVVLFSVAESASGTGPFRLFRPCPPIIPPCSTTPSKRMPYADDPRALRLKFAKGQDYYVEVTTHTKQKMNVMGMDVLQEQNEVFVWHVLPEEKTLEGHWRLRLRPVSIHINIDIGGNRVEYDSTKKISASPTMNHLDAMLYTEFKATVQLDGVVRDVEGKWRLGENLGGPLSPNRSALEAKIKDGSVKQVLAPLGEYLPPGPVALCDQWTRRRTLDLGPIGRYETDLKYTYHGTIGSLHEIRHTTTFKYTPMPDQAGLPFKIKEANLKSSDGEGKILFDADKGRLRESSQWLRLTGMLVIEVGSQTTRVELDQTQTMRVRTLETNPLQK